jgi:small subunit ribosomal protein S17
MYTRRKTRVGVVTSDKMQKTVVVAVGSHKRHSLYNKTIRRTTRYKVHDEKELAKLGDIVRIVESRPLSREKRWRLAEVVLRREVAEIAPREIDAEMLGINRPHTESAAATTAEAAEAPVAEAPPVAEETEAPVEEEASPAETEAKVEPEAAVEEEEAKGQDG